MTRNLGDILLTVTVEPGAVDLARRLDGLPLALATAGAYLDQVAMTCAEYFQLYDESWLRLHEDTPQLPSYDQTLYSTWNLSYKHIKQQEPTAATLLQQWAYFSNGDLWYELLSVNWETKSGWLAEMTKDKLQFHSTMRVLCNHGLVETGPPRRSDEAKSQGYNVHACVHSWMEYVLNQGINKIMVESVVHCVASHVPSQDQKEFWIVQQRLLAHADRCLKMTKGIDLDTEAIMALDSLGILYADQGRLQDAEAMYQRALDGKEKALGPGNTSTLTTVNNLGLLYKAQGRLQDAEAMYQRALDGKEKALGSDHTSTLDTVNNLGLLYYGQGRLQDAGAMYQRALDGKEKTLGLDHPSTLTTVHNLSALYKAQGRLQDAEAMYQRALDGKEKALGPDHTSTLSTVNNLGNLYADQGRLQDAGAMYQRALDGYEKALGLDHTSTLDTVNNLGLLYKAQGRLQDAEAMYQRALDGYEKALGPTPVDTYIPLLSALQNLANIFVELGRTRDALPCYRRARAGIEAVWGRENQRYTQLVSWMDSLASKAA
jgi:tetratricopeptide (TPR) repeat protein